MSLKATIDDLRKYRSLILVIFIFCMVSTLSFLSTQHMHESSAASLSGFKPGNIISDAVMSNYNSMSKDAIQQFLTKKNPCNNTNVAQYQSLKNQYPHLDWHFENGHFVCLSQERFGDGNTIGQGQTAAEIIYQAAQDYKINPQVLLVLLEKEQSLITDTYPNSRQYQSATGYGCPDTAACDSKYYGFKNQVRNAAALFRNVLDKGYSAFPEKTKGVYVGYNPNSACGRSEVYIENRATAALYRYTPYQPNAAALNAGYGSGDSCSAYGNRNFYLYFTDWFGSTQVTVDGRQAILPDGDYSFINAKVANRALGVASSNAQVMDFSAQNQAERWRIKRNATGYYTITNLSNGQVLSTADSITNTTNVQTSAANNACNTQWNIYFTPDGYYTFESACLTGYVADLDVSSNNVVMYTTHGGLNQKWRLYVGQTIENGVYHIASSLNQNQVLDINEGTKTNGARITVWQQHAVLTNQTWQFQYNAQEDYYTITNPYTGKRLDLNGGKVTNGANISTWDANTGCAQKWKLIANADGYSIHSACSNEYAIDLNSSVVQNGTRISLWQYHGGKNQQWKLKPVAQPVADGIYRISSRLSASSVFDIYNSLKQEGTNIAIWQFHGGANQQWQLIYNKTNGSYKIYNPNSKLYLGLANNNTNNGNNIQLRADKGTCHTEWYIYPSDNGYNRIASSCDKFTVVDLNQSSVANGSNITLWQFHGWHNQQWGFTKI